MSTTQHTEFPEPNRYANKPGFVKSNPLNNPSYLDKACQEYPMWADVLRKTDEQLSAVIPGYNISQIKDKFGGLRFYIDIPEGTSEEVARKAWDIAAEAERSAPSLNSR